MTEQLQLQPAPRRRFWSTPTFFIVLAAAIVVTAGAVTAGLVILDRTEFGPPPRVVNGIAAPHKDCVDNVTDLSHPWIYDGWWAGRVDGQERQMTSAESMALSISGHEMEGVWLCPPKRDW